VVAPASALPVGARSGTCGANGGRTRANNPCNSRPTRGQNCCRLHHVGTPAPALPGGARPGTCGANGGVTKAGTPCKLPPGRGQSHCRRH
jgi:hypothetical protein